MTNTIKSLIPSKTVVFKTDLYPNLVRTGVIGDGSCFFHAACFSLYDEYRSLTDDKKIKYVKDLRKNISESITLEKYKNIGQGELFRLQFLTSFRNILLSMPIDKKEWDTHVLPTLSNQWKTTELSDLLHILEKTKTGLTPKTLHTITLKVETLCWKSFQTHLQRAWVDEYCIEVVADYLRCNFYFIESNTRELYRTSTTIEKYRKNIILLWINDTHYESVGEMYRENIVRRVFTNRDKCIVHLKSILSPN